MKSPKTKVGEKAFNYTSCSEEGHPVTLAKVNADYKLVLFWSSWCPHCVEAMPRLRSIYDDYKSRGLEVIAISLDDEPLVWQHYIKDLELDWINVREPYSPDHHIYKAFDVHETPRMFLLSRDLTILSKPSTVRQLEVRLRRDLK
jgi:thiol-disulfide isomerase/thioredoxin